MSLLTRREAIKLMGAGAILSALPLRRGDGAVAPAARRPNILMLVADDQQPGTLGALGRRPVLTPCLDALVKRGMTFTNACNMGSTSGPVCIPGRAMLLTGRPLYQLDNKGFTIPPSHIMLPEHLRSQGYTTFGCGKWHNDTASFQRAFSRGDRIFFGGMLDDQARVPVQRLQAGGKLAHDGTVNRYSTELFADAAVEFLTSYKEDAPFVCYAAFTSPHDPRTPPPDFKALYPAEGIRLPESFQPEHPFDIGVRDIRDEKTVPYPRTAERVKEEISSYYGMISHLDSEAGRILRALKDSGREEETIVIFTSDHGLAMGQHGLMGKQNVYQCSVGIPLVMCGPRIPAGAQTEALCYSMDLFPTLCEHLGLPLPPSVQGSSYAGLLDGRASAHREALFYAYTDGQKAVRNRRYKLVDYSVAGQRRRTQLFDLQEDPDETRDLAENAGHAAILAQMREELKRWPVAVGKRA